MQLTESTKNNPGGHEQSNQDYSDVRMYQSEGFLDPVRAFEIYVGKLHPENPNLLAKVRKSFAKDDSYCYTKEVIGKNTLVNMMKTSSCKAGLSKVYTNHCVRASTVTNVPSRC